MNFSKSGYLGYLGKVGVQESFSTMKLAVFADCHMPYDSTSNLLSCMRSTGLVYAGQDAGTLCLPSCNASEQQFSDVQAGHQQLQQEMQAALATLQHALQQQQHSYNDNAAVMAG